MSPILFAAISHPAIVSVEYGWMVLACTDADGVRLLIAAAAVEYESAAHSPGARPVRRDRGPVQPAPP